MVPPENENRTPPNCYFEVDDCELDWQFKEASFDFIHTRDCYLSIRNWPRLIGQAYEYFFRLPRASCLSLETLLTNLSPAISSLVAG